MKSIKYLLGIIGGLLVAVWYFFTRSKSAEVLNTNLEVKQEGLKIDTQIATNSGTLLAEEENRKTLEERKSEDDKKDVVDFINSKYPPK